MEAPNSEQLLSGARRGDDTAANEIVDRYAQRLISLTRQRLSSKLAQRIDAEDVLQSAYRSFFAHARNDEFVLRRAGDLWRLLAAITLNKLGRQVEHNTAQKRDMGRDIAFEIVSPPTEEPSIEDSVATTEILETVMQALEPPQRQVLEMRLQGSTTEEIADAIGRSQRTVRRWLEGLRGELEARLRDG